MSSGQDLINSARTFLGEPYSTGPGRADPSSGYKDCSGLVAASYLVTTGRHLGADVSVTIYDLCVNQGLWIPKDFAKNIAGACVFMPEDPYQGWGAAGHIGFSDGFGGTVEATPPMVQNLPFNYQPWGSNACMLPGIDYNNYGQGGHEEDEEVQEDLDMYIAVGDALMGRVAGIIDGGYLVGELFTGSVNHQFGIPDSAIAWNNGPGRGLRYVYFDGDPQRFAHVIQERPG